MKEQLMQWQQKIDALNQRERILLMVSGLVVVAMLMQTLLIDPLVIEQGRIQLEQKELTKKINQQNNVREIINTELKVGVNRGDLRRKESLEQELEQLNQKIEESLVTMIPPSLMSEVLENILEDSSGLKLLSIENKPVVALFKKTVSEDQGEDKNSSAIVTEEAKQGENQGLYKHAFVLEFQGNYMAAIKYFQRLDQLPWRFQWDELRYQVEQYPKSIITLEVHTVSMSEEWIGV